MPNCDTYDVRYVIADDDDNMVDDAQGYGYKTKQKAHKAMWYKFEGGQQKTINARNKKNDFFKQHPGLEKFINDMYACYFKELAIFFS